MTVKHHVYMLFATVGVALAIMIVPMGAQADSLVYTPTPGHQVGQTSNNPCIIGDPSCDTNTKQTFPLVYTSASGPCSGGNCDFTAWTRTWRPARVLKSWTISLCGNATMVAIIAPQWTTWSRRLRFRRE